MTVRDCKAEHVFKTVVHIFIRLHGMVHEGKGSLYII